MSPAEKQLRAIAKRTREIRTAINDAIDAMDPDNETTAQALIYAAMQRGGAATTEQQADRWIGLCLSLVNQLTTIEKVLAGDVAVVFTDMQIRYTLTDQGRQAATALLASELKGGEA